VVRIRSGTDAELPAASHEFVDHTSEITLRLRAPSFASLMAEAARAYAELVPTWIARASSREQREFRLAVDDRVATLVEWLNELVYLAEVELWIPVDAEVETRRGGELRIRAAGEALADPFVLVKAATLHRARVHEGPDGVEAEVTLDV
jgi:SHS2 domain-containing protein